MQDQRWIRGFETGAQDGRAPNTAAREQEADQIKEVARMARAASERRRGHVTSYSRDIFQNGRGKDTCSGGEDETTTRTGSCWYQESKKGDRANKGSEAKAPADRKTVTIDRGKSSDAVTHLVVPC